MSITRTEGSQPSGHEGPAPVTGDVTSRPAAGIAFLLLATTLFPIQDVIIKSLSDAYAVHQIVVMRGVFALPIVAVAARLENRSWRFRIGPIGLQLARAAAAFTSYLVYYMALATIGLAQTSAITFSTPIFVTIFAPIFLGERIGWPRWLAVSVGLLGVLTIVRPGTDVFEPAVILALLAAVSYATSIILTRKLAPFSNGGSMALVAVVFYIVAGLAVGLVFSQLESTSAHPSVAFLFRDWFQPSGRDWLLLLGVGLISGVGFFALGQAYRLAEASLVTPFEYTYLPWAVLWGWVFFGALPDAATWAGLILIVGAGLMIVAREAQLARRGRRRIQRRGLGVLRQQPPERL